MFPETGLCDHCLQPSGELVHRDHSRLCPECLALYEQAGQSTPGAALTLAAALCGFGALFLLSLLFSN